MKVLKESELLIYLLNNSDTSKKKMKNNLKNGFIFVNNKKVTQYNYMLKVGDEVSVNKGKTYKTSLSIIFEDDNIIVVNKPYGLLTMSTDTEKEKTMYKEVGNYLKLKNKSNNVFIIHRLDRDTSGVIMFAKNKETKLLYQNNWNELVKTRGYIAVVSNKMEEKEGKITTYLKENNAGFVYSTKEHDGKLAITNYKTIKSNNKYSMLEINLETGRKNQIRVHLSELKHPILGDRKYKGEISPIKRLCLHANILEIVNPTTKKLDRYEAKIPKNFIDILK